MKYYQFREILYEVNEKGLSEGNVIEKNKKKLLQDSYEYKE
ncbi:MAG: hypothetical protein ACR5KV_02195 [Wolbachia sp.]